MTTDPVVIILIQKDLLKGPNHNIEAEIVSSLKYFVPHTTSTALGTISTN